MKNDSKTLYRSQKDRIISGVCGGLAEYFEIDSTVVRIVFILLSIFSGAGILVYILLIFIMPDSDEKNGSLDKDRVKEVAQEIKTRAQEVGAEIKESINSDKRVSARNMFACIIIFLGLAILVQDFFHFNLWELLVPLILVFLGFYIIAKNR